jgi:hypothetical protein
MEKLLSGHVRELLCPKVYTVRTNIKFLVIVFNVETEKLTKMAFLRFMEFIIWERTFVPQIRKQIMLHHRQTAENTLMHYWNRIGLDSL